MNKISLVAMLFSGLIFAAACGKKNRIPKDLCPVTESIFPQDDTAVIVLPNAFSPNGDGKNDVWRPAFHPAYLSSIEFTVMDLSGRVLYQGNGIHDAWTGSDLLWNGIQKFKVTVKAVSTKGNVMEGCSDIYAYFCTPADPPISNSELLFGDQIDHSRPGVFLPTNEQFKNCR